MKGSVLNPAEISEILSVPPAYANRRLQVANGVIAAVGIVRDFAIRHDWSAHVLDPFFSRVELYDDQRALWRRILELNHLREEDVPVPTDALTAALENQVLLSVTREEAELARPEYFHSHEDWTRALAHEMVHQLHVRILKGNEEAMGPQWFFEGFAVFGSGQPLGIDQPVNDVEQALRLAKATGRGSYGQYAAAFRFFEKRIPLARLLAKAAAPDFEAWLRTEVGNGIHPNRLNSAQ